MNEFNKRLKEWFDKTPFEAQHELARLCEVERRYIYFIATNKQGISCSAHLAVKIEAATRKMNKVNNEIPILKQTSICKVCHSCPYTK